MVERPCHLICRYTINSKNWLGSPKFELISIPYPKFTIKSFNNIFYKRNNIHLLCVCVCARARVACLMHACMCAYTHSHAHTHTLTCTHIHTHTHSRAHTHSHAHIHTLMCTHTSAGRYFGFLVEYGIVLKPTANRTQYFLYWKPRINTHPYRVFIVIVVWPHGPERRWRF